MTLPSNSKTWNGLLAGALGVLALTLSEGASWAGVFDSVHFLTPGEFSVGIEPELDLSHGAGVGANLKYTQGLNELMNFAALLGTSSGTRKFRLGGQLTFDFFPDIDSQPGIGITTSGIYYRLEDAAALEILATPYIHKTFHVGGGSEVEPFLAFPFGLSFSDGRYQPLSTVSVGSLFKSTDHLRYVLELGVAVNNTESYFSGGIVYYH